MRDHRNLKVFVVADALAKDVYRIDFPKEEKYGLQSQIRRAAVSVPTNIVEGCARRSQKDYVHFLNIAFASACEVRYLLSFAAEVHHLQLGMMLDERYDNLIRGLGALIQALSPEP